MRPRTWFRAAAPLAGAMLLLAPSPASADVIFDPADADGLAAMLAEAYTDQNVCYGWSVQVYDVSTTSESVGSNFGAGKPVSSGSCQATVEFTANITYTSESSESEDSATFDVSSSPAGVTSDDLVALGLDFDGLTGEDPDVVIGKAVTALPLLAADKGIAKPLSVAPATGTAPADAQLTDDPGSDWWRDNGGLVLWSLALMAASGVLVWVVLVMNRRTRRSVYPVGPPQEWLEPTRPDAPEPAGEDPDLAPETKHPDETTAPTPKPEAKPPAEPPPAGPSAAESPAVEPSAEGQPSAGPSPAERPTAGPPSEGPSAAESSAVEPSVEGRPSAGPSSAEWPAGESPSAGPSAAESPATEPPPAEPSADEPPTGEAGPTAAEPDAPVSKPSAQPPAAQPGPSAAEPDSPATEPPAAPPPKSTVDSELEKAPPDQPDQKDKE